jgi:uncharacterized Ntn-hydrolase superfamily protein
MGIAASRGARSRREARGAALTYSIVARDPATGEMGVAVQTSFFAGGATVPWARPGVGAVATQAIAEPAYGPRCLDALAGGADAEGALAAARGEDAVPDLRQVAVVAADGSVAASTGALCVDHAGDRSGDGFAAAANMASSERVWPAIASAFASASGRLAGRMLAGLKAGEEAGGDARGRMSAALLVVEGSKPDNPAAGTVVDLRVDSSPNPLAELESLLGAADGYARFGATVQRLSTGDAAGALESIDEGLARLPGDQNLRFMRAGALLAAGALDDARSELRALIAERPTWEIVIRGFAANGLMALPQGTSIDGLLERARRDD